MNPPAASPAPLAIFGSGEAAAITLADHLGVALLINEYRGAQYAKRVGIAVVNVPGFVVALRAQDIISDRAARRKLELLEPIPAASFINDARRVLDRL